MVPIDTRQNIVSSFKFSMYIYHINFVMPLVLSGFHVPCPLRYKPVVVRLV